MGTIIPHHHFCAGRTKGWRSRTLAVSIAVSIAAPASRILLESPL